VTQRTYKIAIIGSFRKHYDEVLAVIDTFSSAGLEVSSPARSRLMDASVEFVRLASDPPDSADVEIQFKALQKILQSDAVFVVCPEGYVGRTTCYEIGRIHDRGIPLFFSSLPLDLPIPVPASSVGDALTVARTLLANGVGLIDTSDIPKPLRELCEALERPSRRVSRRPAERLRMVQLGTSGGRYRRWAGAVQEPGPGGRRNLRPGNVDIAADKTIPGGRDENRLGAGARM
jgi:hypothetical protein